MPPELRQLASAGSIYLFQQFGYFLAPIVSGTISSVARASPSDVNATLAALTPAARELAWANASAMADVVDEAEEVAQINTAWNVTLCWAVFGILFVAASRQFATVAARKEAMLHGEKLVLNEQLQLQQQASNGGEAVGGDGARERSQRPSQAI